MIHHRALSVKLACFAVTVQLKCLQAVLSDAQHGRGQAHPEATAPTVGPHVPWTSGVISEVDPTEEDPKQVRPCHILLHKLAQSQ